MELRAKIAIVPLMMTIGILIIVHSLINREKSSLTTVEPDVVVDAVSLVTAFTQNEYAAKKQYVGKVIQTKGVIADIAERDISAIVFIGADEQAMVSCSFSSDAARSLRVGDTVAVRGMCSGYLLDVILNDCIVIRNL